MSEATEKDSTAAMDRMSDKLALAVKGLELEMSRLHSDMTEQMAQLRRDMVEQMTTLRRDMVEQMTTLRRDMAEQMHAIDVRLARVETRLNWLVAILSAIGAAAGMGAVAWLRAAGVL